MKHKIIISLFLFLAAFQSPLSAERVAFFYALNQDLVTFEQLAGPPVTSKKIGESTIHSYLVGKHRVYAAKMGSGCVQTAVSAQALLSLNRCDLVVSTGPAGGLEEGLEIGNWVVANRMVAYQKGIFDSTGFSLTSSSEVDLADPNLIDLLPQKLPKADIASGEIFIASDSYRRELNSLSGCSLVEMNLFGLAMTMRHHDLSGIHFRIISDFANANASADFRSFTDSYDGKGGILVHQFISNLPSSGQSPIEYPNLRRLLE